MARGGLLTLTTDFGTSDHFVGVMKGVIHTINPGAQIVDLCHHINSYDIFDAAYTLAQSYRFFPPGTVHVVVVDPGVGTSRRPIVVRAAGQKFVGPDNGVFSLVYEREEAVEVRHVTADHYFLNPVSHTFHGRDIFAPVAGWLSKGVETDKFGEVVMDYVRFTSPKPKRVGGSLVRGVVLKVDKFGNLITNFTPQDVPEIFAENPSPFKMVVNQREITQLNLAYSMGKPSELFAIVGSSGFLEICTNRGSAANLLGADKGSEVGLILGAPRSVEG
ncbi:MAG TPA: SAM-dependent chlorinase/fluorinase [Terriglobia bacterium]|nr:SAM-dependent chlorinase/fluorinase [Terriglobia bacterium]